MFFLCLKKFFKKNLAKTSNTDFLYTEVSESFANRGALNYQKKNEKMKNQKKWKQNFEKFFIIFKKGSFF